MAITQAELDALTARLDVAFAPHSAGVRLTFHFGIDRINHVRNQPPITIAELEDVFVRLVAQHIDAVLALKDNDTFNIRCLKTHINMPCGLRKYASDPKNRMIVITVMRNEYWRTKDPHDFHVA